MATVNYSNTAVTVGSSSTTVSSAKEERQFIILCNDSDETMYLAFNAAAALNSGTRLDPAEKLIIDKDDPQSKAYVNQVINAICTSGSKTIIVSERYVDAL